MGKLIASRLFLWCVEGWPETPWDATHHGPGEHYGSSSGLDEEADSIDAESMLRTLPGDAAPGAESPSNQDADFTALGYGVADVDPGRSTKRWFLALPCHVLPERAPLEAPPEPEFLRVRRTAHADHEIMVERRGSSARNQATAVAAESAQRAAAARSAHKAAAASSGSIKVPTTPGRGGYSSSSERGNGISIVAEGEEQDDGRIEEMGRVAW